MKFSDRILASSIACIFFLSLFLLSFFSDIYAFKRNKTINNIMIGTACTSANLYKTQGKSCQDLPEQNCQPKTEDHTVTRPAGLAFPAGPPYPWQLYERETSKTIKLRKGCLDKTKKITQGCKEYDAFSRIDEGSEELNNYTCGRYNEYTCSPSETERLSESFTFLDKYRLRKGPQNPPQYDYQEISTYSGTHEYDGKTCDSDDSSSSGAKECGSNYDVKVDVGC